MHLRLDEEDYELVRPPQENHLCRNSRERRGRALDLLRGPQLRPFDRDQRRLPARQADASLSCGLFVGLFISRVNHVRVSS